MTSNLELFPTQRKKKNDNDALEWVGGRFVLPFDIEGMHPVAVAWIELPQRQVVYLDVRSPQDIDGWFAQALRAAMKRPAVGRPRRPARVRVADAALAGELRAEQDGIEVVVAPTPELDGFFDGLVASMATVPHFVTDGKLPPRLIGELFRAAALLYRLAPWKFVDDVIRVDVPQLGIDGACLVMLGRKAKDPGFLLFPSVDGFEAFLDLADTLALGEEPEGIGTPLLSLTFDRKAEVPEAVLRAIGEHGWPVPGDGAYPNAEFRDANGTSHAVAEHEARLLAACASALAAFCAMNRDVFSGDGKESVSESFTGDDGVTVRLTYPFEDFDDGWPLEPVRKAPLPGRNDPCHCGSGKKYKKCHLDADRKGEAGPDAVHALDRRLLDEMLDLAVKRFGKGWLPRDLRQLPHDALLLMLSWAAYTLPVDGRPLADHFVDTARNLSGEERDWLAAQRRAWLGIWEVLSVTPGKEVVVRDLLTGEQRTVREREASRTLRARDALLARVVDHEGVSLFCGMYARSLPPRDAAAVLHEIRAKLRAKGDVAANRLRAQTLGRFMITRWAQAVEDLDDRLSRPPILSNMDGEALAFVIDRFSFDRANRSAVEEHLAAIEGAEPPQTQNDETIVVLLQPGGDTVVARLFISNGTLRVETNSEQRATVVRRRVEEACGALIRHRSREQKDPARLMAEQPRPAAARSERTEEERRVIREFKEQHYWKWLDQPIPILHGKTPRQAARSRAGRAELDLLLRDIEHHEAMLSEGERFDVVTLRKELGL
jgi:hypothetical protein